MSEVTVMVIAAFAAELVLVLFVLLLVAWFRSRAARRRDNKAMRVLVTRIKNGSSEREAGMTRYLGEQMGLSGDALQQAKTAILRAELVLLQRFAGVYRKRDAGAAALFDIDVAAAVAPYQEMQAGGLPVAAEEVATDTSELEQLRADNARLSQELSVTMETMSRMLNEYSGMFAGGAEGMDAPAAAFSGTAGAVATDVDQAADSEPPTEAAARPPDADLSEDADLDIVSGDGPDAEGAVDVVADVAAEVDGVVAAPVADDIGVEIGVEIGGAQDVEGTADVMVEVDDSAAAPAEEQALTDAGVVEQDDVDALFVSVGADNPSGAGQGPAVVPAADEPEPVSGTAAVGHAHADMVEGPDDPGDGRTVETAEVKDVLDELLGDDPVEVASAEPVGVEATAASGEEIEGPQDAETAAGPGEGPPAVEMEAGDDLETVADLLEQAGPAEVVGVDELEDLDPARHTEGDALFDPAESEIIVEAEADAADQFDSAGTAAEPDMDELFDAIEEPLKTQTGQ